MRAIVTIIGLLVFGHAFGFENTRYERPVSFNEFHIKVKWHENPNDSLVLAWVKDYYFSSAQFDHDFPSEYQIAGKKLTDGYFSFVVSSKVPFTGYFVIKKKNTLKSLSPETYKYVYVSPILPLKSSADNITLDISSRDLARIGGRYTSANYNLKFSGKGSEKYTLLERANAQFVKEILEYRAHHKRSSYAKEVSNGLKETIKFINSHGMDLPVADRKLVLREFKYKVYSDLLGKIFSSTVHGDPDSIKIDSLPVFDAYDSLLGQTPSYISAVFNRLKLESYREVGQIDFHDLYKRIRNNFSGDQREKLFVRFFTQPELLPSDQLSLDLADALSVMRNEVFKNFILQARSNVKGKSLSNLFFTNLTGQKVGISDFKGKIVIMDYWFTGCSPCLTYFNNVLHPVELQFKDNPDVVFLSICTDPNKELWLKSIGVYSSKDAQNLYSKYADDYFLKRNFITTMPRPLMLDGDGVVVMDNEMALRSKESLARAIEKELNAPKLFDTIATAIRIDDSVALGTIINKNNINACYGEYSLLSHSIRYNARKCFNLLIRNNADVNKECGGYVPPLMHAIKYGRLEMVKILVAKGANIDYQYKGTKAHLINMTPALYAEEFKQTAIITYLKSIKQ